jgi:sigma-B regulation protein RsbU (phosphoserine phosphatase)
MEVIMSQAATNAVVGSRARGETKRPVELICSEVWGGNREVDTTLTMPGLVAHVFSHPCGGPRGGDVHYVTTCSAGLVSRVLLADVVGHGEQVSQVSEWLHGLLRRQMNHYDTRDILTGLNQLLSERGVAAMTTAACLDYHAYSATLTYCYAGHPPTWHYRAREDSWRELELPDGSGRAGPRGPEDPVTNIPLGISPHTQYDHARVRLEAGDRLLLISDGVLEAPDAEHDLYGRERLATLLHASRGPDLHHLARQVVADIRAFARDRRLDHDDVTLILVEAGPRLRAPKLWYMLKHNVQKLVSRAIRR